MSIAIFVKPAEAITEADLEELVAKSWPEGYQVEFKEALSHKHGKHPWMNGPVEIGEHARDEILSEVVAFANAQGGQLILGIAETKTKPAKAGNVTPLPNAGMLAERFADAARSCIDPPLPRLQIFPVLVGSNGDGVVVFRTGPSRSAPHRLARNNQAYVRNGASTLIMDMRQIQEMTLNVARGAAGIEARFAERRGQFHNWQACPRPSAAYRITAIPVEPVPDPGRMFNRPECLPNFQVVKGTVDSRPVNLDPEISNWRERPIIRGVLRHRHDALDAFRIEWNQDGMLDWWWADGRTGDYGNDLRSGSLLLRHPNVMGSFVNVIALIRHHRLLAGAPDVEYGLEVELHRFDVAGGPPIHYAGWTPSYGQDLYRLEELPQRLPRYSVGPEAEFGKLVSDFDNDVFDWLGARRAVPPSIEVDWQST